MATVLLEARPYRPFKSSEEYLYAMREDLAEWMNTMYPELNINVDNFMDRLDTGVALCKHANNVRQAAEEYIARRQARNKMMTRSMTSGLAGPILAMGNVHFLTMAKSGTFFARDNVSNFIAWCRKSLKIFECLLFETDDLIMRKNEKHVILCLLEVARRGAKFGMLAPMLVQMERQIDREIAADNKAMGISVGCGTDTLENGVNSVSVGTDGDDLFDTDSDDEDENNDPMMIYGPQPQIITNDLKSLDEMVRDLVEKCTCPSQFPMVRVSEGKYRIGDTKVLIFVRILRSHVMVRVGGGWDTLSHYLDKHDPCRCRAQHRTSTAAKLVTRTNHQTNGIELHKAQVFYDRSPPTVRKQSLGPQSQTNTPQVTQANNAAATSSTSTANGHNSLLNNLSPPARQRSRSRSPTPQRRSQNNNTIVDEKTNNHLLSSPHLGRRSASPSPRRLTEFRKKQHSIESNSSVTSSSTTTSSNSTVPSSSTVTPQPPQTLDNLNIIENGTKVEMKETTELVNGKADNISDNGSEISDEGYRSLGIIQNNKRASLHSDASNEDVEVTGVQADIELPSSTDSPQSETSLKITETSSSPDTVDNKIDLLTPDKLNSFERAGIRVTDDEITLDIASSTGLRKTGFSDNLYDNDGQPKKGVSRIPRSPLPARRKSIDNSNVSIEKTSGLPINRKMPVYRSVRKTNGVESNQITTIPTQTTNTTTNVKKDGNSTWSGRATSKTRPSISSTTYQSPTASSTLASTGFNRNTTTRSSTNNLYDKNGRKIKSASVTTSPVKKGNGSQATSPLAKEILQVAGNYKNDTQILEKMKELLNKYAKSKNSPERSVTSANTPSSTPKMTKTPDFEDFTTAWVNSSGSLELAAANVSPKVYSKRSSIVSSTDSSANSKDIPVVVGPSRKDRGCSRIPAPVRASNEIY